jgi:hypothetical protein
LATCGAEFNSRVRALEAVAQALLPPAISQDNIQKRDKDENDTCKALASGDKR